LPLDWISLEETASARTDDNAMRRTERAQTFFRGRERSRLMLMIALLVVLFLAIQRSRRPESWAWLIGHDDATGETQDSAATEPAQGAGADKPTSSNAVAAERKPDLAYDDEFPPDQDDEEKEALAENLETVEDSDGKLGLQKLEMPAYWRLVDWAKRQTPEAMAKRKIEPITFDLLIRQPSKHRGQLARFDLNVRRVLKQPAEQGNPLGLDHVYELIGFSEEGSSRLYFCIVPDLPQGMPVGLSVDERVTFVGYFLKNQGFEHDHLNDAVKKKTFKDAGPLFIGRVVRQAMPAPPSQDPTWAWWLLGGAGAVMVAAMAGWIVKPRWQRPTGASSPDDAERKLELEKFMAPRLESWETGSELDGQSDEQFNDDSADAWKRTAREP
jgi:hypothetical protein